MGTLLCYRQGLYLARQVRLGLDLHQRATHQSSYLHHRGGRADAAKHLAMRAAYFVEVRKLSNVDARAHYVFWRSACLSERLGDNEKYLPSL